jgi:broad specificity phosphatase PhoE
MCGPDVVYLIRHAEKPTDPDAPGPKAHGVDIDGVRSAHSLTPRGWQRAGALALLFSGSAWEHAGPLVRPDRLLAVSYGSRAHSARHRAYQTLTPLGAVSDVHIELPFGEDDEKELAASILGSDNRATLVAWDHTRIPRIAEAFPVGAGTTLPDEWPDERFDMIWCFTRRAGRAVVYDFEQLDQRLLAGDAGLQA